MVSWQIITRPCQKWLVKGTLGTSNGFLHCNGYVWKWPHTESWPFEPRNLIVKQFIFHFFFIFLPKIHGPCVKSASLMATPAISSAFRIATESLEPPQLGCYLWPLGRRCWLGGGWKGASRVWGNERVPIKYGGVQCQKLLYI